MGARCYGGALYWVSMDMHGPHYGWSMHQASAMLLVPDSDLSANSADKSVYSMQHNNW